MSRITLKKNYGIILSRILGVFLALFLWHILAVSIHQKILLVTPGEVALRLLVIWKEPYFFESIWFSMSRIGTGLFFGAMLGVILSVISYEIPFFEGIMWPWMATIKSVPVASFVVICLVWLSSKNLSIFISFLIVLPIVYNNMLAGQKSQDVNMKEVGKIYKLSFIKRFRYIMLPQLSSYINSALSTGIGMAWKAGVAAEVIGTPNGSVGRNLYLCKMYLDTDGLLAWTVVIVIVSLITEKLIVNVIKLLFRKMRVM